MLGTMLGTVFGAGLFAVSSFALWSLMPTNGKPHRYATTPFLDSLVPFGIICGMTLGIALFLSELPVWK